MRRHELIRFSFSGMVAQGNPFRYVPISRTSRNQNGLSGSLLSDRPANQR